MTFENFLLRALGQRACPAVLSQRIVPSRSITYAVTPIRASAAKMSLRNVCRS